MAEQGASSKIKSNGSCLKFFNQQIASAQIISWASSFNLFRFSFSFSNLCDDISSAVTWAPLSMSWAVFPPGAAQTSKTLLFCRLASNFTAKDEEKS